MPLSEFVPDRVWLQEYPIHFAGCDFDACIAVIKTSNTDTQKSKGSGQTSNVNWLLKLWWKVVFHMRDNPKPARKYQMGRKDNGAARKSLQRILEWDFDKIVLSHGDLIETNAKSMALRAWEKPLGLS